MVAEVFRKKTRRMLNLVAEVVAIFFYSNISKRKVLMAMPENRQKLNLEAVKPFEMSGVKSKLPADDHVCGATSPVSQLPPQTYASGRGRGRGTSGNASPVVGHPPGRPEEYYGSAVKEKSSNKSSPTENLQKGKDGEHYSSDDETEKRDEKKAPGKLEKIYNAFGSFFKIKCKYVLLMLRDDET